MPHIQQLPPYVADLIAAGEVVERPASVVKELVENSIDAGCSAVVVELRRGGMGLIRVTDNGCGIEAPDLPTAFLRHATSKLRGPEDLGKIGTLGFRGEALAAIAAVSRLEIVTRPKGRSAASLTLEGGVPSQVEETGAPEGTTIMVRDLFYNTPARLKFMKKDSVETAAVSGLMQHLSLSHPDISFKFIKDGAEVLHTPGDGRLESAVYAALGRDFAKTLIPIEGRGGEVSVSGFVTQPLHCRGSRSMQVFFVNGRFIKSQLLTAALEESYRNQNMKGRFPGCVLAVTLPVTGVDVNVHPAKTQVKFAREKEIFDAVYHTALDALNDRGGPIPPPPKPPGETVNPRRDIFQTMDAKSFRQQSAGPAQAPPQKAPARPDWNTERRAVGKLSDSAPLPVYQTRRDAQSQPPAVKKSAFGAPPSVVPRQKAEGAPKPVPFVPAIPQEPEQQTIEPVQEAPWRIAGEIFHTYIICESGDGSVYLIDKHAAHERINFDRLMSSQEPPMRQALIQPIAAELSQTDKAILLDNLPLLEKCGFACEDFGGCTVLIREVPADIDAASAASTLEELAACLSTGRTLEERRQAMLHTMACKASIKGGWTSDKAELQVLADKVQSGEVKYCPHGRPVAVKLTKYELEKMFKRS